MVDVPIDFYTGSCTAAEVRMESARGDGKIMVLDAKGNVVQVLDPETTTIWIKAKPKPGNAGS